MLNQRFLDYVIRLFILTIFSSFLSFLIDQLSINPISHLHQRMFVRIHQRIRKWGWWHRSPDMWNWLYSVAISFANHMFFKRLLLFLKLWTGLSWFNWRLPYIMHDMTEWLKPPKNGSLLRAFKHKYCIPNFKSPIQVHRNRCFKLVYPTDIEYRYSVTGKWKEIDALECVPNGCTKLPRPHHGRFLSLPAGLVHLKCDVGKCFNLKLVEKRQRKINILKLL